MIRKQERLKGKPVADPFVIARAKISGACVVTQEKKTGHFKLTAPPWGRSRKGCMTVHTWGQKFAYSTRHFVLRYL